MQLSSLIYYPTDAKLNILRRMLKFTLKLTLKGFYMFRSKTTNMCLCFAKIIEIKIVSLNLSVKHSSAMWLHSLYSPVSDVYSSLCSARQSYAAQ